MSHREVSWLEWLRTYSYKLYLWLGEYKITHKNIIYTLVPSPFGDQIAQTSSMVGR